MAEVDKEPGQTVEGSNAPKNKLPLDQMSKEELLKQVKRQLVLLQKAKSKSDEMSKRCSELEKERDKVIERCAEEKTIGIKTKVTELESELETLRYEKEKVDLAYLSLQQAQEEQKEQLQQTEDLLLKRKSEQKLLHEELKQLQEERDNFHRQCQSSREQLECMKMKVDTLTETCHCLQEEIGKLQSENGGLQNQVEILTEERDKSVQQLKSLNDSTTSQCSLVNFENLKQERDSLRQSNEEMHSKISAALESNDMLSVRMEEINKENKNLLDEKLKLHLQWEQAVKECESWKLHVETFESEKEELHLHKQQCPSLKNQIETYECSIKEIKEENQKLLEEVQDKISEVNNLQTRISVLSSEITAVKDTNVELQNNLETLKIDKDGLQDKLNKMKNDYFEVTTKSNEETIKVSTLEIELSAVLQEKQGIIEKLYQLQELQQFIEDEARGLREENEKLKLEVKRLEADLENDILHIRKLENELQEAEERERVSYIELDRMKEQFHEIEKADQILRNELKCKDNASIENMLKNCDLDSVKEQLVQHLGQQIIIGDTDFSKVSLHEIVEADSQNTTINAEAQTEFFEGNDANKLNYEDKQFQYNLSNSSSCEVGESINFFQNDNIVNATEMVELGNPECITTGELHKLEEELKTVCEREMNLKQVVKDKSDLVEKIHCEMDGLLHQIEELNAELEEKSNDLKAADKVLQEQQEKINDLKNTSIEKDKKLACLDLEINNLRKENSFLTSDLEALVKSEESQEGLGKVSEILKLRKENSELDSKIENLNKYIHEKEEELKNAISDSEKLKQAEQAAAGKVSGIRKQLTEYHKCFESQKQITTELEEQLNIGKMASERTEREMMLDIQNLTQYLQEKKMQVHALDNEKNLLASEVNMLQMSIKSIEENFNAQIYQFQQELNEKTNYALTLEQQNKILEQHLERLTSDLRECETNKQRIISLENELIETQKIAGGFQLENVKYREELNVFRSTLAPKFEDEINLLRRQLEEKITAMQNLEKERMYLLNKVDTLENNGHQQKLEEDMASIENLQKALKESDIKMAKFKALAIKVKKELSETKKQLGEVSDAKEDLVKKLDVTTSSSHQHLQNFKTLQNEYDNLQDEYESMKLAAKHLEQDLSSSSSELLNVKEQLENFKVERDHLKHSLELLSAEKKAVEQSRNELDKRIGNLEMEQNIEKKKVEEMKEEFQKSEKKARDAEEQVQKLQEQHKITTQQLEQALKEAKKQSLIDLEMADYERTISELNNQLHLKNADLLEFQTDLAQQKDKVESLQEEIKHCENQRQSEESRANSLKEVLTKIKAELATARSHEAELKNNEAALSAQLESLRQQEEGYKVQLSEAASKQQHLEDALNSAKDSHQRSLRYLEAKISSLDEELKMSQSEIETNKQEFENYKVRVHSVLKQQKHSSPSLHDKTDQDIKDQLEKTVDNLKLCLEELNDKLHTAKEENSILQAEYDRLLQRHNMLVEELHAKDLAWNEKYEQLNIQKSQFQADQEKLNSEYKHQTERLTISFKEQLQTVQAEHKIIVEELQKQLDAADKEIGRLRREQQKTVSALSPSSQEELPPFDIFSQERQEGEGSEFTEGTITPIKHLSLATIPTSGFTPLEQLLQFSAEPQSPVSSVSQNNSEELTVSLTSAYKKIDHLSEVLNESEASNLHLEEQVRVLKEEIRRLERNKERERHAENLEYLKNVVMKFITLTGGSERERLIPILTTLLRLSPEEHNQLQIAAGDSTSALSSGAGWGNYLHRWSGFM